MTETIYIIYQTANLINGKTYIGQHQCSCRFCTYLGSGTTIKRAIAKYGKENFKREILFTFDNFDDMNAKEIELVTEDYIALDTNYNLRVGGTSNKIITSGSLLGVKKSKSHRHNMSIAALNRAPHSKETKMKLSKYSGANNKNSVRIITPSGIYDSYGEACREMNISTSTLRYRCKTESFVNYCVL